VDNISLYTKFAIHKDDAAGFVDSVINDPEGLPQQFVNFSTAISKAVQADDPQLKLFVDQVRLGIEHMARSEQTDLLTKQLKAIGPDAGLMQRLNSLTNDSFDKSGHLTVGSAYIEKAIQTLAEAAEDNPVAQEIQEIIAADNPDIQGSNVLEEVKTGITDLYKP